jgi:hypothetical protein
MLDARASLSLRSGGGHLAPSVERSNRRASPAAVRELELFARLGCRPVGLDNVPPHKVERRDQRQLGIGDVTQEPILNDCAHDGVLQRTRAPRRHSHDDAMRVAADGAERRPLRVAHEGVTGLTGAQGHSAVFRRLDGRRQALTERRCGSGVSPAA